MVVVEYDGERRRGRAFDLRDAPVDAGDVADAIRGGDAPLAVRCPSPGPVHERVGIVREGRSYPIRAALAATARELGHSAPQDDELDAVREALEGIDPPSASTEAQRRRVAAAGEDLADLESRIAALRGRIEAVRERGGDAADLRSELEAAIAELADRRTDRVAAEQALERAREDARRARDRRERRLRLQDRERNLRRDARRHLAAAVEASFRRALAAVPGECSLGEEPAEVSGDPATAALGICRMAPLSAPVVVGVDRFPSATAAAAALAAPVVLV